jgi:hypothetical protein
MYTLQGHLLVAEHIHFFSSDNLFEVVGCLKPQKVDTVGQIGINVLAAYHENSMTKYRSCSLAIMSDIRQC